MSAKPFLDVFGFAPAKRHPIWLMRQAGRYLPEYRALRAGAKSFLDFCYTPELAIEATMQPVRRFGFDAAIIFSDILVIPDALGQQVRFVEGEGPRLEGIDDPAGLARLAGSLDAERLAPVYAAIRGVKALLPAETALIGFCGAPWTLATYMIAGEGTPDQAPARLFAYRHPIAFEGLIGTLVDACVEHLAHQIEAGADAVQIFDSWAGPLPEPEFRRWCEEPVRRITWALRQKFPDVPVIGFPRAIAGGYRRYVDVTGVQAIGLDTAARVEAVLGEIGESAVTQGNLDPLALVAGGAALDHALDHLLGAIAGRRHILNLGHGILPSTPIGHVERLIEKVRG